MIRNADGSTNCASVFTKSVAEISFNLSYVLYLAPTVFDGELSVGR